MSWTTINNETDLLERVATGDENAFNRLYFGTNSPIYNAVMVYVKNPEIAREIVQVVYIKIWDNREKLAGVRSLEDYLFILSRNAVFDYFKKLAAEKKLFAELKSYQPNTIADTGDRVEVKEYDRLLKEAINSLPPQQKRAYILAGEEKLTYEEIAGQMELSRATVKRHLELARRFVRAYINEHLHSSVALPVMYILISGMMK